MTDERCGPVAQAMFDTIVALGHELEAAEDRERYLRYQVARLQAEKTEFLALAAER